MTRIYVVTGAASGIGAATTKLLKLAGHKVVTVDIHDCDVNQDLSTAEGRKLAVQESIAAAGGVVDAVIACAGLALPIAKTVSVNYWGMTDFLTGIRPALLKSAAPRAVVITSMASLMPNSKELVEAMRAEDEPKALKIAQGLVDTGGGAEQLIYGSTKRALARWVRAQAPKVDWAGSGIPLNSVGPGIVETPMVADMIATEAGRESLAQVVPMPLHGYLKPEQVGYLLVWLASEENTHLCGQVIYIDGGSDVVLRGEDVWSWKD